MDSGTSTTGFFWSRITRGWAGLAAEGPKISAAEHAPLGSNLAALGRDLARMADLQLQLLSLDVKQFWSRARTGLFVSCLAGTAVVGAIPVLLFGVAGLLERFAGLTPEIARLIVGAVVLLGGAVTMWFSLRRIGEAAASLKRSQEEMSQNLKWIRDALNQNNE